MLCLIIREEKDKKKREPVFKPDSISKIIFDIYYIEAVLKKFKNYFSSNDTLSFITNLSALQFYRHFN